MVKESQEEGEEDDGEEEEDDEEYEEEESKLETPDLRETMMNLTHKYLDVTAFLLDQTSSGGSADEQLYPQDQEGREEMAEEQDTESEISNSGKGKIMSRIGLVLLQGVN